MNKSFRRTVGELLSAGFSAAANPFRGGRPENDPRLTTLEQAVTWPQNQKPPAADRSPEEAKAAAETDA